LPKMDRPMPNAFDPARENEKVMTATPGRRYQLEAGCHHSHFRR
jgi:hypothetical protein